MMHITEDTPPDMLAGAMDLTVHLPNGRSVKMSVERSTPMMDLLVQIVTAHQLQLSGHIIQALEMAPSAGISDKVLPYKPNTPIGALDTQHIKVVPKNRNSSIMKNLPSGHQPFESTFRLKVHLPRNQLYVTRVSQNIYLDDIMNKVCKEKNLDPSKYEFRHPGNLDEVLDPKLTLSDYQITEIYVVSKGTGRLTQAFSTSDIMALRKEEERKQFQAKTGGGVFNLIFKRGKSNAGNGSISSDNRSISPTHSDDSRSVTPPNIPSPPIIKEPPPPERPKPPQRKRRPAPKPPQTPPQPPEETKPEKPTSQISNTSNNSENSGKKAESSLLICHSRNSSDSSGYHEASILSDNCNTSLPRRPKTMIESEDVNDSKLSGEHSRSTGNLAKTSTQYKSTSSLAVHGRKKKAAPPPPPLAAPIIEASVAKTENASPVVASQPVENLPESVSTLPTNQTPPESIPSSLQPPSTTASATTSARTSSSHVHNVNIDKIPETIRKESPEPDQKIENITEEIKQTESDMNLMLSDSKNEADSGICEKEDLELETVWKYQLPSPPKAFRDASPAVPTLTQSQYDTETLSDSVVTNPELFEKLQYVKDIQDIESDIPSVISEDEKEMCNKLTLEHLEKRKSLVYNRELATSLKFAQETDSSEKKNFNTIKSDIINELEDVITNSNNSTKRSSIDSKVQNNFKNTTLERNLPNFQISSYDTKKEKINIFEDDSIRSNVNLSRSNSKVTTTTTDTITNGDSNLKTTSSLENIPNASHRNRTSSESSKNDEQLFKKPQEISTYRLKNSFFDKNKNINAANVNNGNVNRSGSFSASNETWTPVNRIKRSKSHITLNKYMENNADNVIENLAKSSSLLDMSASLQSLQVMKTIQNKLSHSKEELDNTTKNVKEDIEQTPIVEPKPQVLKTVSVPSTNTTINYARGPPAVNLGTWSQRPKSQVTLKEDTDYKINTVNTKLNSTNYENDYRRNSSLKTSNFTSSYIPNNNSPRNSNGVSVKVNGESISTQKSGNVVIKIGGNDSNKEVDSNTRFINHITPDGYRKPLGNVNKIERSRPHSIAYDNQFDISRVPVVRSVELKKPFKDLHNNKSITQIYSNNIEITEDGSKSLNYSNSDSKNEKQSNVYLSNESINKPVVFRNNSFTPLVKGFRTDNSTSLNRKVWSVYGTLPSKPEEHNELNTNKNVPFSQMNLRRTESNKVLGSNTQINSNNNNIFSNVVLRNNSNNFKTIKDDFKVVDKVIPSPPPILKDSIRISKPIEKNVDPRADLLSAIRNFGGKKGLRTSKG